MQSLSSEDMNGECLVVSDRNERGKSFPSFKITAQFPPLLHHLSYRYESVPPGSPREAQGMFFNTPSQIWAQALQIQLLARTNLGRDEDHEGNCS
jgi:hypothetical protein